MQKLLIVALFRTAISMAFGSLLFMSSIGEAHAYLDPCQALGVACPDGTAPPAAQPLDTPFITITPAPLLEIPITTPQTQEVYYGQPLHGAAPLPRTGMGGVIILLLLSISSAVCWTQFSRSHLKHA